MAKSVLAAALLGLASGCVATRQSASPSAPFTGPHEAGRMVEPAGREASGLAASPRHAGLLWTHEDSDTPAVLHALDESGRVRGRLRLTGVQNIDWEDLASFEHEGQAWLCVGDVGDNNAVRPYVLLHFVAEPAAAALAPGTEVAVPPARTVRVIYEDGPRDCESIAVDAQEGYVYLLSKREPVPRLYRVPLAPTDEPAVARFVGPLPHLPQPDAAQRLVRIPTGAFRGNPCALDFAADGSAALVLTYGDVLIFPRPPGTSWAEALARPPLILSGHGLSQAEAACFSADGRRVFVASENTDRLLRYDRR